MRQSAAVTSSAARALGGDAGDVRYPYYLINGRVRAAPRAFTARPGQRARIRFINAGADTAMHIHGHTFQAGPAGPRKDTVIVLPGRQVACDFDADNPGQWVTHCHNLYHAPDSGMMAVLGYQA